jgi:hypothetical protein
VTAGAPRQPDTTPIVAPAISPGVNVTAVGSIGIGTARAITRRAESRNETSGWPTRPHDDVDRFVNASAEYVVPPAPSDRSSVIRRSGARQARAAGAVVVTAVVVVVGAVAGTVAGGEDPPAAGALAGDPIGLAGFPARRRTSHRTVCENAVSPRGSKKMARTASSRVAVERSHIAANSQS